MVNRKYVSYYRVSTRRQGQSGLGLEAQKRAVQGFLSDRDWNLVDEFIEVESGKRSDRPQLTAALAACRIHNATLLVAKLDRLARNAHFLLGLKEAGVEFIAVDMPSANRLTVGIMAMVAEEEARMISARTKAALEAAKQRGVRLGNPANLRNQQLGSKLGNQTKRAIAQRRAADLMPIITAIRANGANSLRKIAEALNERGIQTSRGAKWRPTTVSRILSRASSH